MVDRAHEVLDLLPGRPRLVRAETQLLVEWADALEHGRAEEDGERDRAVPEVVPRETGGHAFPRGGGVAALVDGTSGQAVQARILGEATRNSLEQVGRVRAVVVRERDEVGAHARQRDVSSPRGAPRGPELRDVQR